MGAGYRINPNTYAFCVSFGVYGQPETLTVYFSSSPVAHKASIFLHRVRSFAVSRPVSPNSVVTLLSLKELVQIVDVAEEMSTDPSPPPPPPPSVDIAIRRDIGNYGRAHPAQTTAQYGRAHPAQTTAQYGRAHPAQTTAQYGRAHPAQTTAQPPNINFILTPVQQKAGKVGPSAKVGPHRHCISGMECS